MMVPSMTAVRIVQEDQVVLAGAGLALVAVDEDVLGLGRLLGNEGPLHAGREARAAAAAQAEAFISLMIQSGPCARHFFTAS